MKITAISVSDFKWYLFLDPCSLDTVCSNDYYFYIIKVTIYVARPQSKFLWGRLQKQNQI